MPFSFLFGEFRSRAVIIINKGVWLLRFLLITQWQEFGGPSGPAQVGRLVVRSLTLGYLCGVVRGRDEGSLVQSQ